MKQILAIYLMLSLVACKTKVVYEPPPIQPSRHYHTHDKCDLPIEDGPNTTQKFNKKGEPNFGLPK